MLRVKARMGKRHPALSVAILCAALVLSSVLATASDYGSFVGRVLAEWLDDGRLMRLEEPFEYVGPDRRRWPVPKGTIIDGASIPRPLWSVIGGPFEAKYRNASVVHDYYCDSRTRAWEEVHAAFYHGMLASKVEPKTAWLMYQAVMRFGPRWEPRKVRKDCLLPNGRIDFSRCTENSLGPKPAASLPQMDRRSLEEFIREVEGATNSVDIQNLKEAAKALR